MLITIYTILVIYQTIIDDIYIYIIIITMAIVFITMMIDHGNPSVNSYHYC